MEELNCKIIRIVNNVNEYREFPNYIFNKGRDLNIRGNVTNVQVLSDSLISGEVIADNSTYKTTIKLNEKDELLIGCTCNTGKLCEHEAALSFYVKTHKNELDLDYIMDNKANDSINLNLNLLKKIRMTYYNYFLGEARESLIYKLCDILQNNLTDMLDKMHEDSLYYLFFDLLSFHIDSKFHYISNNKRKEILDQFYNVIIKSDDIILNAWKDHLTANNAHELIDLIFPMVNWVDNENASNCFCKFIQVTIDYVINKIYKHELELRNKLSTNLVLSKLSLLEKFGSNKEYLDYFELVSLFNNNLESNYILYLLNESLLDRLVKYIQESKSNSVSAKLVALGLSLRNNKVSVNVAGKMIIDLFGKQASFTDYKIIKELLTSHIFEDIKDKLIKLAKMKSKYDYIEIEIDLNKENGYNIAKSAGIIEFNKHINHYKDRQDELIEFYQEELSEIFSKSKTKSKKFYDAIDVLDTLKQFKHGKYFVFQVLRLSKLKSNDSNPEVIYELIAYVNRMGL